MGLAKVRIGVMERIFFPLFAKKEFEVISISLEQEVENDCV